MGAKGACPLMLLPPLGERGGQSSQFPHGRSKNLRGDFSVRIDTFKDFSFLLKNRKIVSTVFHHHRDIFQECLQVFLVLDFHLEDPDKDVIGYRIRIPCLFHQAVV